MRPATKVTIVAGGYLLALVLASAVVALHAAVSSDLASQALGGMSAFGDLVLFVAVFGAAALLPTGAACFFLLSKEKTRSDLPKISPSSPTPPEGQEPRAR